MRITEIKRHPDGHEVRFELQLVRRDPHLIIASYVHPKTFERGGFTFERGAVSYGFFWRRRPYVVYRMLGRSGELTANRFDVVDDVRFGEDHVSYLDLLLDAWSTPDGDIRFEDEDEVAEAAEAGQLSASQQARIARTKELLEGRHAEIARECAELLA